MEDVCRFDYYYGNEAEQFAFYRIPRMLIKHPYFRNLSSDAKLLYGLMLDRMTMSVKNGWFDNQNRAYIIYSIEQVMDDMGCGRGKAVSVMAELDSKKGIGLIERVRIGQGHPDMIYVKNFITVEAEDGQNIVREPEEEPANPQEYSEVRKSNFLKSENRTSRSPEIETQEVRKSNFQKSENRTSRSPEIETQEVRKSNFQKSENRTSRSTETELPEVRKSDSNYINNNHNDMNYINPINQSGSGRRIELRIAESAMDEIDRCRENVKKQIEYRNQIIDKPLIRDRIDNIVEIMVEVLTCTEDTIRIGSERKNAKLVQDRFRKINSMTVSYALECLDKVYTKISNIKGYMLATLFNAPVTIDDYYRNMVNYDLYGAGMDDYEDYSAR